MTFMRYLKLLLFISTLVFVACGEEDEDENSNADYAIRSLTIDCSGITNCGNGSLDGVAMSYSFYFADTDCATVQATGALTEYVVAGGNTVQNQGMSQLGWTDGTTFQATTRMPGGTYTGMGFIDIDGDIPTSNTDPANFILETGDIVCCLDDIPINATTGGNGSDVDINNCQTL